MRLLPPENPSGRRASHQQDYARVSAGGYHSIECQWDFEGLRGIRQPGRLARRATLALPVERVNAECNDQQHSDWDEKRGVPTVTCLDDDTGAALLPVDPCGPMRGLAQRGSARRSESEDNPGSAPD